MKYEECYTVTSHDVDINNNMKPSLVLRYMQETANHHMRDRKPSYYDLFFQGKSFILTRVAIEILDEINQYDEITVKTWRCLEKGATFIRCFSIEREGKLMAKAYSEWAVSDRNTGRLCRASEVDISNYDTDEVVDLSIAKKFRISKDLELSRMGDKQVFYTDVDMNKHMNNTYYPDMLWNFIPDILEKKVTSVNLRFKKEAPLWSDLEIFMAKMEDSIPGDACGTEGYCFVSKIDGEHNVEAQFGVAKL